MKSAIPAAADPPILMYHRVCRDEDWRPSPFVVAASVFREQLAYLARAGYHTPPLSEVLARQGRPPSTRRMPVVLTFDDGYKETLDVALPIMQKQGFTAAVFPVLELRERFPWWECDPSLRAPLLSAADMRTMEAEGIEFGSHTLSHARLTRLADEQLLEELARSREVLGSVLARPLPVLAYPYGDVNPRVKRAAHEAGYAAALAVYSGPLGSASDPLEIRRVCVANSASETYLRLTLSRAARVYRWFKWKAKAQLHATSAAVAPSALLRARGR